MNLFEKQSRLNQLFTQSPVNAAYLAGSLSNRTSFETKAVMDYLDFKKFDEIQNQALGRRLYGQVLPVDKELLQRHLKQLREAIVILRDLGKSTREEFTSDFHVFGLAERYLQIAIEACLLISGILVASLALRRPEGYHELLSIVAAQRLIPQSLSYRLEVLTNLRDALVHDPGTLNHDLLYDHIQQRLEDFEAFAAAVEEKQTP